jgi:hypothetical protein
MAPLEGPPRAPRWVSDPSIPGSGLAGRRVVPLPAGALALRGRPGLSSSFLACSLSNIHHIGVQSPQAGEG